MPQARILIVEDEQVVAEDLRDLMEGLGYAVCGVASTGPQAIALAESTRPDLVLMDIKLAGEMDGISAAEQIRACRAVPLVFLTAFIDEATLLRARRLHPEAYLTKPFHEPHLHTTLHLALYKYRERREQDGCSSHTEPFAELLGLSTAMQAVYRQIKQLAAVDSTVLIQGETGTGKECVARALHRHSARRTEPFITVNCAALTETLAASELYGHRRGAFTGATSDHAGLFEAAQGGVIFLDEIGEIPRSQQPFLLRVLEEREVTRVGESQPRKINVRVLAATNVDLDAEAAAGRFRRDLLYRIRVATIHMPPLRRRTEDVARLAHAFLERYRVELGRPHIHSFSDAVLRLLVHHAWPGNVRELRNVVEIAVVRCEGSHIELCDLPAEFMGGSATWSELTSPGFSQEVDRERILQTLARVRGNRTEAARQLGISRATFYRRLAELKLDGTDA